MSPPIDLEQAHRYFAADCFNRTWTLIEAPERDAEMNQQMLLLSLASLWHWTQLPDCSDRNLSIGYWLVARVYALLGQPDNAMRYAEQCQEKSRDQPAFYQAYSHEALARAAVVGGDMARGRSHFDQASALAAQVGDPEEYAALEGDMAALRDVLEPSR